MLLVSNYSNFKCRRVWRRVLQNQSDFVNKYKVHIFSVKHIQFIVKNTFKPFFYMFRLYRAIIRSFCKNRSISSYQYIWDSKCLNDGIYIHIYIYIYIYIYIKHVCRTSMMLFFIIKIEINI